MDSKLSRSAPRSGRGQGAVVGWLDERFPLVQSVDAELYRRVPNYASAFYRYLGGLALIILFIEFLTGFLIGVYYFPDGAGQPAPAFTSVDYIQHTVYLGWLVRGIHFWGASVLIVVALLHMTFVFWTGGYRAPRELNWMVGVVVFLAGGGLVYFGKKKFESFNPLPDKTFNALQENLSWKTSPQT